MTAPRNFSSEHVYCASQRALVHATAAYVDRAGRVDDSGALTDAMIAAHHPRLGLDRSVCLRDVVEWLYADPEGTAVLAFTYVAQAIEREFTDRGSA